MTTKTVNIRWVRCPKCRVVLPEPEVPVYRCGGCSAVLQAKIRKTNTESTVLNCDKSDANGEGRLERMVDEKEINGSNEEATVLARAESSSDCGSNGDQVNGLNQVNNSERGEPLLSPGSNGNPANGLNQETHSERGESLLSPGSNGNPANGLNQATSSGRDEPSLNTGSPSSQDNCLNKEITLRGECSSGIAINSSQDISPNKESSASRKEDVSNERNEKLPGGQTFSPDLPNLLELGSREEQGNNAESTEQMEQNQCDDNADRNSHDNECESGDLDRNCTSGRSFSEDFYSSVEFLCHETEGSSPEHGANKACDETYRRSGQLDMTDQTEPGNCKRELREHHNFLSEFSLPVEGRKGDRVAFTSSKAGTFEEGDDDSHLTQHIGSSSGCKFEGQRIAFSQNANSRKEVPLSTQIIPLMQSPEVKANAQVNEDLRVHNIENLEKEDNPKIEESGSHDADENPSNGRILSDNVDSDDSNLGVSQGLVAPAFGQHRVSDSPENLPLGSSSSEFDPKHRKLSKSPTKCYYGPGGSASSYDGSEVRIPNRSVKPPRRRFKHANSKTSNGLHKEDGPWANDSQTGNIEMQFKPFKEPGLSEMQSNESEIRYQARKPPIMPEKSHPTTKYRTNPDDLHDPRSSGHSIGGRMREDKDEHISTVPYIPNYLQTRQRKARPTLYPFDSFQHYSAIGSSGVPSYPEPDKVELLRMVNELKEELSRIQISNSRFPLIVAREEKYTPTYYDHHLRPLAELPSDLSYSRYTRRFSQESGLAHLNQPPRMAFSGDAADYMRHADCACQHFHPQDWQYSVQIPSHSSFCGKVHGREHSINCYSSPCSTSSSPHRCKSSEFSVWDHDTMSVDQRHRDSGIRNMQLRERYQSKRHVRPVAGGNPIIACYNCSELLQLPADFLLVGRRYHKLRCNACGKVLKFALQSGKHIVPSVLEATAPPPSMVDYNSESFAQGNQASASHSNGNADVDPVSFSEDYGGSFERSYSTEAEPSALTSRHDLIKRNTRSRKMSYGDTVMTKEDTKMKSVLGEYQKMPSKSLENFGAAEGEPSSKRSKGRKSSSEIKETPGNGGSPLHRLMGYSSPSAVMKN